MISTTSGQNHVGGGNEFDHSQLGWETCDDGKEVMEM